MRSVAMATCALAMFGVLSACSSSKSPPVESLDPLVGAWQAQVQFHEGAFAAVKDLQLLYAFNAGGTMLESSNYDGAPPVPPAYGSWRQTAPGRYELRYRFFTSKPPADFAEIKAGGGWMPAGHGDIREQIELAGDGRSYTSRLTVTLFDTDGKPIGSGETATGQGARIEP